MVGLILLIVILLIISLTVYYYNRFVKLKNQIDNAWSDIDVQLKRRYDLIPNLVETVKGYAKHEKDTLENVIKARNMAMNSQTVEERAKSENMLTGALKTIFALAESYPDLKANQSFLELQKMLADVENDIQMARRYYNAVVRDYNVLCESFPSVLIAKQFNFSKREFFETEESERENIKVEF
ncbi:LemA family protein [Hippea maritima]|uniref:LemA family protein n=1 Tax=Hippea maritima (strain ATCC 700847 / DSM 10411 / MH2) TaxID=760142 RepID=F2LVD7_HIPMA|nr:LemA family protein [Hippea maritima DSM 10411]